MPKQDFKFKTPIRVRWMEGDAQGIVFNGAYLGYLEVAQAEYFRNLGFSIYRIATAGYFDTAVVKPRWSSEPRPGLTRCWTCTPGW